VDSNVSTQSGTNGTTNTNVDFGEGIQSKGMYYSSLLKTADTEDYDLCVEKGQTLTSTVFYVDFKNTGLETKRFSARFLVGAGHGKELKTYPEYIKPNEIKRLRISEYGCYIRSAIAEVYDYNTSGLVARVEIN
jgi:hypothetical protein